MSEWVRGNERFLFNGFSFLFLLSSTFIIFTLKVLFQPLKACFFAFFIAFFPFLFLFYWQRTVNFLPFLFPSSLQVLFNLVYNFKLFTCFLHILWFLSLFLLFPLNSGFFLLEKKYYLIIFSYVGLKIILWNLKLMIITGFF